MRASRLLSLLLLLQNRGLMSAAQLATELGVTMRTIYRDVEALAAAGVPIYAEQGPAGGYRLMDGYRTRLTGLTADEAGSLFLTGMPQPAAELGLGAQLAAAELKLMAALPTPYRDASLHIRQRFHLDAPGWFREPEMVPHLLAVAEAVWQEKVIDIGYRRWAPRPGTVTRRLHPLGLVLKAGVWYLVAGRDGEVRTYRVASIIELTTLAETSSRPDGFDLAGFWRSHVERYERTARSTTCLVRLSPQGIRILPDLFGAETGRLATESLGPADGDGWRQAVLPIESIEHAATDLLRLGAHGQVLAPPELVARIGETVRGMAVHYPAG
ncbi:putative DNA-binding transcriptional regulator YafY [Micromonospora pisi]|uniref:Putative DNA-binding transcriptional regulator YafY n=1 Tax=Micromonospora pisi TaxID=589240 RepID=A0A495JEU5_9ACTN|nr:WYL domain-containing protein [Micromonospora pisi]RKR87241.1 putative DNA-binding transcriptional regulator YafY [Micromonospora pisi]